MLPGRLVIPSTNTYDMIALSQKLCLQRNDNDEETTNKQPWLVTGWSFCSGGADWTQSHNQMKKVKWQLIGATRKRFTVKVSIL